MKRFTLDKGTPGGPVLEIEEVCAREAQVAKKVIIEMLTTEEKYDAVIENFVEFERDMFDIKLDYEMFGGRNEDWFNLARNRIDRRLFNLLSSCRSYLEFASHCTKNMGLNLDLFKGERSKHYDESFGYRVMDELRDHLTYAGNAAHTVTFSDHGDDASGTRSGVRCNTPTISLSVERLQENTKLKAKLRDELKEHGPQVEFVPLLREYIRCLSQIHDSFRSLSRKKVSRARQTLSGVLALFLDAYPIPKDVHGLVLREYDEEKVIKEYWILASATRLDYFESKNRTLHNLERPRATNAVPRSN